MADAALWTIEELVTATGGRLEGKPSSDVRGLSIDTRTLEPGDAFVAIRGDARDGHDFATQALGAGAALAIVSRITDDMRRAGACLVVDEPLAALTRMAEAARARSQAQIVAVTGSVGKTSTKEALRAALSTDGATHASAASYNNHWGVPLSLARMPRDTAYGVFEIGMNHAGEITPLTRLVRPHVAIVTGIAESHLGHFNSLDGIADAKAEIFLGVEPDGAAIINAESPYFHRLTAAAELAGVHHVFGFGERADAEFQLVTARLRPECSCVTANILGDDVVYKIGAPGRHLVMNSLAVLGAVKLVGADLARAALALAELSPPKGRGVRHAIALGKGHVTLIDESYNANPASMRAALAVLAQTEPGFRGRRIAVLGDMLELGRESGDLHAGLAPAIAASRVDLVFACGTDMARLWDALPGERRGAYAATSQALVEDLRGALREGDVVMVKGSLGSKMGLIVEALKAMSAAHAEAS
ncbi:MAG: UDP-N-acetylmuramoylalanyl-D-glutamyl-2,6-diaminopimelate--D-alanyl-D-alanine ligase [Hyphomicrobiales bacterium]